MTLFTLFWASGDLAKLKIFPSLFSLYRHGLLPEDFVLMWYARSEMTREVFHTVVRDALVSTGVWVDDEKLISFLALVDYYQGSYDDIASYEWYLSYVETEYHYDIRVSRHLVYLSVPPSVAPAILDALASVFHVGESAIRVILEKPFGHDRESAHLLFEHLYALYPRESLYFLDHYLGKETIRNLALRDGSTFLSRLLSLEHIESIEISAIETVDAGGRIGYFDSVGTIEDMIQSHLIQMLSFAALDTSNRPLRERKLDILESLRFDPKRENIILGQYSGYRSHDARVADSDTETYGAIRMELSIGDVTVPVFFRSGKALEEKSTYIHIHLKPDIIDAEGCEWVTIDITKNQVLLHSKTGEQKEISIARSDICNLYHLDAHEVLFLDVMDGDDTFFLSSAEIELAWWLIDSVKETMQKEKLRPYPYVEKSKGPEVAVAFYPWLY